MSEYKLPFSAKEIEEKLHNVDNAVFHAEQTLTEEQKAQVRENIGAVSIDTLAGYHTIEFEQGTIGATGEEKERSDRIRSVDYYPIETFTHARITNPSFQFWLAYYDSEQVFSSMYAPTVGYTTITREEIISLSGLETGYVRFVVFQVKWSDLLPNEDTGFAIYGSILDDIEDTIKTAKSNSKLLKQLTHGETRDVAFEHGGIKSWGEETTATNRIKTDFLDTSTVIGARVGAGYRIWYYTFDITKNFLKADKGVNDEGYRNITFNFASAEEYVKIVIAKGDTTPDIALDEDTGFVMTVDISNKKIDDAVREATKNIGSSRKGALGLPEYLLTVYGVYSDATWVGDKYVGLRSMSTDNLDDAAVQMVVYDFSNGANKPHVNTKTFYHKWGHCNTVDYSHMNDCLIMGNGSGSYELEGKIFIIPNFSALIEENSTIGNESNPFTLENTNAVVIDCTGYDLGTKFNVMWGEINGTKHNIAYLVTAKMGSSTTAADGGDNGTIRRLLLGVGSTALEYGQFNETTADGAFNGTFSILDTYTQGGTAYAQCNQGSCFYKGSIYSAIGHDGIWLWEIHLGDGRIFYDEWKQYTYNDDGSVTSTNSSSCCVKDGYLYFGAANVGVMAFRL